MKQTVFKTENLSENCIGRNLIVMACSDAAYALSGLSPVVEQVDMIRVGSSGVARFWAFAPLGLWVLMVWVF